MRRSTILVGWILAAVAACAAPRIEELGVPVRGVGWVRLHPGTGPDGEPSLLITMAQHKDGAFVLDVDMETGHCRQFNIGRDEAALAPSSYRSPRTGVLWLGSAYTGHLHRYDPAHPEKGFEDLGPVDTDYATFPTGIAEGPDGRIYVGAYPGACLSVYDPASGEWTRHGRMDPVDKYYYPLVGDDGTVAGQIKSTHWRIVAFDPATGQPHRVGPHIVEPTANKQRYHFYKGTDGLLYLDSFAGAFRIQGTDALPVERSALPPERPAVEAAYGHGYQQLPALPDGRVVEWADPYDIDFRRLRLRDPADPSRDTVLELDWQGSGSELWTLHFGPDDRLYGSSMLPERFFATEADGADMIDYGRVSHSLGEAYSMINLDDGTMAIASYPKGRLSLYDPRLPYRFGTGPGANPLDIGPTDKIGDRPHAMATTPDGRLWIASAPQYGLIGGTLAWRNLQTLEHGSHRHIIENCSPFSLLWLPELERLLVGFIVEPGTGRAAEVERGGYALWDPVTDSATYIGDFGDDALVGVTSLAPGPDGLVYAISARNPRLVTHYDAQPAPSRLLLLDPAQQRVVAAAPIPESFGPMPFETANTLRFDSDGTLYGTTAQTVFRIQPGTVEIEEVARFTDGDATVIGPIRDGWLYFASIYRLRRLQLAP
ncbi:lactonase family protein [Actomonas aquatica]|uniref:Lactonase family protein n=1 Tax=Actomonas aquatica TaxID=2866162 RepID=A0ABZ1CEE9_9BACT|nr:lactonase family protein [Opitutus sp. WL0086]WRQ90006.1 lactonase family protein [Opitutus sp. WL0086]